MRSRPSAIGSRNPAEPLILCGARSQPAQFLDQAEFVDHIGRENIVPHVQEALNRALQVFEDFSGVGEEVPRDMATARM
jgi:hypothetical protein